MGRSRPRYNDPERHQFIEGTIVGEIRVRVLLTNALDESLNRRRKLKKSAVRRYEADALVDTGALRCIIPAQVMEKLGVLARGTRVAEYADGRTEPVDVTEPIASTSWDARRSRKRLSRATKS
jgi:hypothetical protein